MKFGGVEQQHSLGYVSAKLPSGTLSIRMTLDDRYLPPQASTPRSYSRAYEGLRRNAASFLSCLLILGVVFLPVFVVPYASHDQYRHFVDPGGRPAFKQSCMDDPYYVLGYRLGRPISAEGECLVFKHTSRLSDLNFLRLWVLMVMAMAAACYASVLRSCGLGGIASVCLSLAVFTLPGAQAGIFMTSFAVVGVSTLTATIAHMALQLAQTRYTARRYMSAAILTVAAAGFLLAALFTYQFLALFFLAATMAHLLFDHGKGWRQKAWLMLRDVGFFTVAAGIYWSFAKFLLFPRDPNAVAAAYSSNLVLSGLPSKLAGFVRVELPRVLALWYLYPNPVLFGGITLLAATGLGLYMWRGGEPTGRQWNPARLVTGAGIFVLLLASIGPFLSTSAFFLYRIFFVLGSLFVLLLYWSAVQIVSYVPKVRVAQLRSGVWIAGAICAAGCCLASRNTILNVMNSYVELAFIQAQIAAAPVPGGIARIHLIQPGDQGLSFNGLPALTDEFNRPSTTYWFDITHMVRAAMLEMGGPPKFIADGVDWLRAAQQRARCFIVRAGPAAFRITRVDGAATIATVHGAAIEAPAWKFAGTVTPDRRAIQWSDGTIWGRPYEEVQPGSEDAEAALEGEWTMFDGYPANTMLVTSSKPGEQVVASHHLIVIDMNVLLDSAWGRTDWSAGKVAAERKLARAFASNHRKGYEAAALNDGTPLAWGSAEGMDDVYFGLEFSVKQTIRSIRITAFSPEHRPHLREFSVVAADSAPPPGGSWSIVRSRVQGSGSYTEKVVVPPVEDNGLITIEVDPGDAHAGAHQIWALACLSRSRGYARNYLTDGTGVYVRELEMASAPGRRGQR